MLYYIIYFFQTQLAKKMENKLASTLI